MMVLVEKNGANTCTILYPSTPWIHRDMDNHVPRCHDNVRSFKIIQDPSILQNLKMESLVQPFWQPPLRLVGPSIPPTHSHLSAEDLSDDGTFLYFEF
jgi:hypothetical protein